MKLDEAKQILNRAGLIAEETTEDALARMAANSYEGQVDEIVETIEKVKHVKNYYEVDPDEDYVKAQFEIVMQDDTVWEVQFRRGHGFNWRGNVYPWRIIKNNNGGFTQVAFSMSQLRAYMKKVKAIQTESQQIDEGKAKRFNMTLDCDIEYEDERDKLEYYMRRGGANYDADVRFIVTEFGGGEVTVEVLYPDYWKKDDVQDLKNYLFNDFAYDCRPFDFEVKEV